MKVHKVIIQGLRFSFVTHFFLATSLPIQDGTDTDPVKSVNYIAPEYCILRTCNLQHYGICCKVGIQGEMAKWSTEKRMDTGRTSEDCGHSLIIARCIPDMNKSFAACCRTHSDGVVYHSGAHHDRSPSMGADTQRWQQSIVWSVPIQS